MKFDAPEFYPTPEKLLKKITEEFKWWKIQTVLEPSAGKGNIAEYIKKTCEEQYGSRHNGISIDCIEIDSELRSTLKGKDLRVVHDDFLTFKTFKKYDLIIMNPPFSNGSTHLMKALEMQKNGGYIICILNAETLKNPYSNERKVLVQKLEELNADIQYMQEEFVYSEHSTNVEIAVIKLYIEEKQYESTIFSEMKKKVYQEDSIEEITDLAPDDFIAQAIAMYNIEVESGIKLIKEYKGLRPHIMSDLTCDDVHKHPIISMKIGKDDASINSYVEMVRLKYWTALFQNPKFTGNMTSNLRESYVNKVQKLRNYDFSLYNIKCIQLDMSQNLIKGIEDCIIELFDKLSYRHSYHDEFSNNIHYYNGWKTNQAWFINKKVIIPYMNAFSTWSGEFQIGYEVQQKLADIEKALNYLDGGLTECLDMMEALNRAKETGQTQKIELKYFYVTFYKKGTCHLMFKDEELLKKFNIFGSQQKGWLPPSYGKKTYQEMDPEERAVIDEFEGELSYKKTLSKPEYFLYSPKNSITMIETKEAIA